ncbi:virulence factor Mce-like protein [Nocardia transvalensis]|uniref:Virulence factor Mce-like protein n=1 Tax=Nocardia transvalensis TaxID=37333 RepID=A0A7W9UK72_9NOCA|nr:MlaD family protein [Nocardia transvalensis]MBB5915420.1 virulence factor Mce-like protein [Nocardia transvalensis]
MITAVVRNVMEPPARALVYSARLVSRHSLLTSCLGLVAVLVLGAGYLTMGSLRINPFRSQYQVRVELAQSGGLLPAQDVTLRGVRVGRVRSVDVNGDKVVAVAAIDSGVRIPSGGDVRVSSLSAAGEQFLDFLPTADSGPYLSDGAVVTPDHTSTPTTMADVLGSMSGTLTQIDPAKIEAIVHEVGGGSDGPQKLAAVVDGGMFMLSTLDSVLPQTVSLLHNSKAVLHTVGEMNPGLQATAGNLAQTAAGVDSMTGGYRTLAGNGPNALAAADTIIADNSPTMVQLLGNLTTTSQMAYQHIPAMQEFFWPQQRTGSTLDAIRSAMHDGAVWAIVSPYPKYACDYDLPRDPGSAANYPEPYLHARCTNPDPSLLPRGAANAPRPPGDDTATIPPGVDPAQRADPTPTGPYSLPTTPGGPFVPGG